MFSLGVANAESIHLSLKDLPIEALALVRPPADSYGPLIIQLIAVGELFRGTPAYHEQVGAVRLSAVYSKPDVQITAIREALSSLNLVAYGLVLSRFDPGRGPLSHDGLVFRFFPGPFGVMRAGPVWLSLNTSHICPLSHDLEKPDP